METINKVVGFCKDLYGIDLSKKQIEQLKRYEELLIEWNVKINLTAILDHEGIWYKHFLDSMCVIPYLSQGRLLDIGTGAGFPGLVIKIVRPELDVVLMDATAKKLAFIDAVIEELELDKVVTTTGRAEELAHENLFRGKFDYVTTRAVSAFSTCLEISAGYSKVNGDLLLIRGPKGPEEAVLSSKVIVQLGLKEKVIQKAINPLTGMCSHVMVYNKKTETQDKYPRTYSVIDKEAKKIYK